jgi:sec-independent protein translocase protein TatC
VRRVEKKREKDLRAQGLWFEDDDGNQDPMMAEFDEDDEDDGEARK